MSTKPKILVQLDGDVHASVFDAVVALDSGVDHLLPYHRVEPKQVRDLVHGAIFTRGPQDLHQTAIFVGGSDVTQGEILLEEIKKTFFGPMRVSVLMDANGANTTAAAAVLAAARHVSLQGATAAVLGATGPVGQRAARLLSSQGARVRVCSRSRERAEAVCEALKKRSPSGAVEARQAGSAEETLDACRDAAILIAAGAPGVELLSAESLRQLEGLRVAIDLNAVPPLGLGGIEVTDKAVEHHGITCYGAIGVGGTKMKIHKAAIRQLFERNDQVLDAEEVFAIGQQLAS